MSDLCNVLSELKQSSSKAENYFEDINLKANKIKYSNQFEQSASKENLKTLNSSRLPKEYVELFKYNDGACLFNVKMYGYDLGFKLQLDCSTDIIDRLHSHSRIIITGANELLIGHLLDVGDLCINLNHIDTEKPYLYIFTIEGEEYINEKFDMWLINYIKTFGREYLPDF